jgi:hypothetical protein
MDTKAHEWKGTAAAAPEFNEEDLRKVMHELYKVGSGAAKLQGPLTAVPDGAQTLFYDKDGNFVGAVGTAVLHAVCAAPKGKGLSK